MVFGEYVAVLLTFAACNGAHLPSPQGISESTALDFVSTRQSVVCKLCGEAIRPRHEQICWKRVDSSSYRGKVVSVTELIATRERVRFGKPEIVSEFNEKKGQIKFGKHLCPKLNNELVGRECSLDLNVGFELFESKDLSKAEYLYCLLNWISEWLETEHPTSAGLGALDTDFFSRKSMIRRIGFTTVSKYTGWKFGVIKYQNVHFLCEFPQVYEEDENGKRMTFYGNKFEQYMTSPSNGEHLPAVSTEEGSYIMVRRKLGNLRLLFRSECDAFDPKENSYVEMKTISSDVYGKAKHAFRKRAVNWWWQSFLSGIEKIVVGLRSKNGIVVKVETLYVDELPEIGRGLWNGDKMIRFTHAVLSQVKNELQKVPELTQIVVEYDPKIQKVMFSKADPRNTHNFLPVNFTAFY